MNRQTTGTEYDASSSVNDMRLTNMNPMPRLMVLAMLTAPLGAIEPPMEAEPIPPQQPPVAVKPVERVDPQAAPVEQAELPAEPAEGRPFLGVILDPLPPVLAEHLKLSQGTGLIVSELVPDGPAEQAGVAVNDVLLEVGGKPVCSLEDVREVTSAHQPGDSVALAVVHEGERKELQVELAAAPRSEIPAPGAVGGDPYGAYLDELPGRQADLFRRALERNQRALDELNRELGMGNELPGQMFERLRQQMRMGGDGLKFELGGLESSIRLEDNEGGVEIRSNGGGKEAKVFDREGQLLWEGPYETEQDKAAVPEDIRQRLDKLDLDSGFQSFGGKGFRFRLGNGGFRSFDEMDAGPEPVPDPAELPAD